ncbi:MAG: hypothetical protein ACREOI_10060 [bacterium]
MNHTEYEKPHAKGEDQQLGQKNFEHFLYQKFRQFTTRQLLALRAAKFADLNYSKDVKPDAKGKDQ